MRKNSIYAFSLMVLTLLTACKPSTTAPEPKQQEITDQAKSKAVLSIPNPSVVPGGTVEGMITISLDPGWHTYGDPPGDSGMPPTIKFTLPDGWKADVQPLPPAKEFKDAVGTSYGYEDNLIIKFRLTAPQLIEAGTAVDVSVDLQWLICNKTCIPMTENLTTKIKIPPDETKEITDE